MSDIKEIQAELRTDVGKGSSRRLRRIAEKLPAIIYGGSDAPIKLSLVHKDMTKALENEAFYSSILTVNIEGKKEKAVVKAIQRHPYKVKILHMDFLRISAKEAIIMNVALHFIGEETAPGIKQGGLLTKSIMEVEIKCLPKDLPTSIEVDISQLELDQTIHLSNVKIPTGVTLLAQVDAEHDLPVAAIHLPRVVEEVEEKVPAEAEEGEEEAAEGEEATKEKENKKDKS